jgi:DNA-binding MarR family transcriptional regulator
MNKTICRSLPLGRSLAILTKSYYGALTNRLEHLEIERYYSILILIESLENGCTQQYICDQLKMDKVSMVRIINFLIEKKYLRKIQNPSDKRAYLVELTKKSIKMLPEIHQAIDAVNAYALNGISASQQKTLYRNLSKMQTNLEELPTKKSLSILKNQAKENEA